MKASARTGSAWSGSKGGPRQATQAAGQAFISALEPFVWRRHLDYWAIADVHAIKNMINAKVGAQSLEDPAPDVKLGPGGIREIEFFVQTQQIILGGRNPSLRVRGTLGRDAAPCRSRRGGSACGV